MVNHPVSRNIEHRQRTARHVVNQIVSHQEGITAGLEEFFAPLLRDDEEMPDFGLLLTLMQRTEEERLSEMIAADQAHREELADDPAIIDDRDSAYADARELLLSLRRGATATYGAAYAAKLHLSGATPKDPEKVLLMVGQTLKALENPLNAPPEPIKLGITMDVSTYIQPLTDAHAELNAQLEAVKREEGEAARTHSKKVQQLSAFDDSHRTVAALYNGLARASNENIPSLRLEPTKT